MQFTAHETPPPPGSLVNSVTGHPSLRNNTCLAAPNSNGLHATVQPSHGQILYPASSFSHSFMLKVSCSFNISKNHNTQANEECTM